MTLKLDKDGILKEINKISTLEHLESLRIKYLGKKGLISLEMKCLSSLSIEEKKIKGQELNIFKSFFETEFQNRKNNIEQVLINEKLQKEKVISGVCGFRE